MLPAEGDASSNSLRARACSGGGFGVAFLPYLHLGAYQMTGPGHLYDSMARFTDQQTSVYEFSLIVQKGTDIIFLQSIDYFWLWRFLYHAEEAKLFPFVPH